ncbi:PD-(D/E)XK nuclease family protein [Adhaeribacter terreus]|uniref:PD-(D/E)XK nuclease family protein n=1 Tax=Adhaeribacter terreus TaxID=529703 RepID=A0ABW0EAS3_9BACT
MFNKLFNLHLKASNRPLEDYLTEIFAFCLDSDKVFRERFLNLLKLVNKNIGSATVETQSIYAAQKRRTDLEINLGHSHVIIESKIASTEGIEQLDSYAKILAEKGADFKLLVFLTAKREDKFKSFPSGINFQQLRWHDIGLCIKAAFLASFTYTQVR